jgi:hypothetical protein
MKEAPVNILHFGSLIVADTTVQEVNQALFDAQAQSLAQEVTRCLAPGSTPENPQFTQDVFVACSQANEPAIRAALTGRKHHLTVRSATNQPRKNTK